MRIINALNSMMLVAITRKDYDNRRLRTTQGIEKAKERDELCP